MKTGKRTGYPIPLKTTAEISSAKPLKQFMPYPGYNPENNLTNPEYARRMIIESEKVRVAQRMRGFVLESQAHLPATERSYEEICKYMQMQSEQIEGEMADEQNP